MTLNLNRTGRYILFTCLALSALTDAHGFIFFQQVQDTTVQKYQTTRRPTFRLRDRYSDPFSDPVTTSPFFLKDPFTIDVDVVVDSGVHYTITERMSQLPFRPSSRLTLDELNAYHDRQLMRSYWQGKSRMQSGESPLTQRGFAPKIYISPVLDRIFGGSYIELIPRGFVTLDFGASFQRIDNPNIPVRMQRNGGFDFDQQINMSVIGKVGEKLAVSANFDTNNSFDFQNNMKVEYTGFKEDILKKLEIGNVNLPLNNTLIQGAQNLFGVKAQWQFGKLFVTTVASTQRGKVSSIDIPGSNQGQGRPFEIVASGYDENRHFFLAHFFRDNYERWLQLPPQIYSGINITRVEVYVLNRSNDTQTLRNVVGLMDLGEGSVVYNDNVVGRVPGPAFNGANDLQQLLNLTGPDRNADQISNYLENVLYGAGGMVNGTDFERITSARKLNPTEFTFHRQLGYITLARKLQNDEALAVAFEYTFNGRTYKVGELTEDYSSRPDNEVIFLKLLRPRKINIRDSRQRIIPTWDLMMKNIYSLNVSQLAQEGFQLRIVYRDDRTGIDNPQLQEGVNVRNRQLIEIFGLDRLNPVNDLQRDGNFDFVEGLTINSQYGLIIFPFVEPFNTALRLAFAGEPQEEFLINKYVYDTLYRTTRADAELFVTKNKFFLVGRYVANSAREILIPGFGVTPGSVRVFAGGTPLLEGVDYTVDYTFGRVNILNDAILNSGKNISVQYEQADPFTFQNRTLLGTRFDYKLNEDVNFGSTLLYYNERPWITRNLISTEPARNLQYGFDFNVRKESRLLTKLVDALPGVQTREKSFLNWSGEFAQLLPGTSNKVQGEGTGYIDDFENTATPFSLMNPASWRLAATPRTADNRFDPSMGARNDIRAGYKRAKLAWYIVDNQFYRDGGQFKPPNITGADLQNHYVRAVGPQEVFPLRNLTQGNFFETVLDVAYYPNERGPYNYDTQNLNPLTGEFTNPAQRWAGITTAIRSEVDFDKANIEYIEFWLLDPFISYTDNGRIIDGRFNDFNTTGGKLIFHLGSVSEDVIRDGRHAFENGLPPDGDLTQATENNWGYVTRQQYITNAFDNSPASRANQDVGLDGVRNDLERIKFQDFLTLAGGVLSPEPFAQLQEDPSSDNFKFFFGPDLDARNAKILERYKNFNGMDGNTPINTGTSLPQSNGFLPDNEDLNADNTLNELEEYYEYILDLRPGQLEIGRKYIVDKITTRATGSTDQVTWYLFRIPIRNFDGRFGNIEGFKSIRYLRMVLTEFQQPVVLRFVNFRMIGARWRRYTESLEEGGLVPDREPDFDNFTLSVVNIEENAAPDPDGRKSPYVVPPGIIRDRDNTSAIPRQLNEQSMQLCVDNLADGDARAAYKNVEMDFFNYGRVKMFVHGNSESDDGDLVVFMRLGTDFDQNYYEVELPLKITRPATTTDPRAIWPEENEFDFALNTLYALKAERDRLQYPLTQPFPLEGPRVIGRHGFRIMGRPNLSAVRLIMIGIRNPRTPDKRAHSACVWVNELRLTDFDRSAGWAVNSTLGLKLADLATVSSSIRHTTFGFGSVSSKISERTREEITAFDITSSINLEKLLPGNHGLVLPLMVSYQTTTMNPNYDPANPDQRLEAALQAFNSDEERAAYLRIIRDQEVRRAINFTNIRKTRTRSDAPANLWDIENFSFSYRYSQITRTNFNIAEHIKNDYGGSVAYTFNPKSTAFEPFKNASGLKSPYLKLLKDFNLNLMPTSVAIRADLDRSFTRTVYRNAGFNSDPNFLKYFTFNRFYNTQWSISRNLSVAYTARANAIIDEPEGDINTPEKRDSVMNNLKRFGRMKNFDQNITLNYRLPLDKLPLTDWISADYRYQANFNWKAGPFNRPDSLVRPGEQDLPDSLDFKNTVQNSRESAITGQLNLVNLYNKVKFLKDINTPPRPSLRPPNQPDTTRTPPLWVKKLFRTLMMVRSVNATYSISEGTLLPGFEPTPRFLGMDRSWTAPGWSFILGSQNPDIRLRAAENGWLTRNTLLTSPFSQNVTRSFSGRANLEPTIDLKIQLDIKKDVTDAYQEIFRFDDLQNNYISVNPSRNGSYRISVISLRTAFRSDNNELVSRTFQTFEQVLEPVVNRFRSITGNEYDSIGQDVLIPAFIAAYMGKNVEQMNLSPFQRTPLPNWRIDYTGLNKIKALSSVFQSVTLTHAYSATYTVMNYSNSLQYTGTDTLGVNIPIEKYNNGFFARPNSNGQIVPVYIISQVMISEQFAPLIGINLRTKSRFTARAEYKTKRDLALNISNAQITEMNTRDVSLEIGYTKNNMKLPFKVDGRTTVLKNDVTFRMNLTVSDQSTIQRKINDLNILTNGNINFQMRPNISYVVNQRVNIQAYFERTINTPQVSNAFKRAVTRFGIQMRISLS